MPIHEMVDDGSFRQDLLYRINTIEIRLPALRERGEDIQLLANHFLRQLSAKYKKDIAGYDAAAIEKLNHYDWPGNVRELQHAIERAVILGENGTLTPADFLLHRPGKASDDMPGESYKIDEVEKNLIRKVLRVHKSNISRSARELGITRASLYRRMEKYGLK